MLSMADHASPCVLGQKLHGFYPCGQETGEAHRTGLYRAEQRVPTHAVDLGMSILKGIHYHHFCVEIAAEVRVEHSVLPLPDNSASRVDEHGAHSVVPALRRH